MLNRKKGTVSVPAPAKINLHLDITGSRPDGYHDLISLFQMISLCDELTVSCESGTNRIELEGFGQIPPSQNLAGKAASFFKRATGITTGIRIFARKNIPLGAGLGGGSSNAAAVLRALNFIYDEPLSFADLNRLGLELGSDVCFFLDSVCALVTGRGENITPIHPRLDIHFLIVIPDFGISTKHAYALLDQQPTPVKYKYNKKSTAELISLYTSEPASQWIFFNSFLPLILGQHPELEALIRDLKAVSHGFVGLSGSGSAFFAVLPQNNARQKNIHELEDKYAKVILASPLSGLSKIRRCHID